MKRKVRDIYGNWVWQDEEEISKDKRDAKEVERAKTIERSSTINLDWRDYIALFIASLETILLPLVIFILVIAGIALALAFFH